MSNYAKNTAFTNEMREAKRAIKLYMDSQVGKMTDKECYRLLCDVAWEYFLKVRARDIIEENEGYEIKPKRKNKYSSRVR